MIRATRRAVVAGLGAAAAAPVIGAGAQTSRWPEKSIKLVVPFPPGGGADYSARIVAARLGEGLGQPVIVENRPGAGTAIANDAVAKAAPDGYTLLQVNRDMAINPSVQLSLPYDTLKSFAWIGKAVDVPVILCVNPKVPVTTLAELAALAKSKPGKVTIGHFGAGGLVHLNVESLVRKLGIDMLLVTYKGAGPTLAAAVAGEIDVVLSALTGPIPFIRDNRLRPLAVGLDRRSTQLPDVPTFAQAGAGSDTVVPSYFGLGAPVKTPPAIIERVSAELKRVMALPDVIERHEQGGLVPAFSTPKELEAEMTSDVARFAGLVKMVGITPQ
jgi:tripartite-type tricarboxylate transporter receptor subunit TctC